MAGLFGDQLQHDEAHGAGVEHLRTAAGTGTTPVAVMGAVVRVGAVESVVVMVVVEWGNHVNLLKIYRNEIYLNRFTMVCKRFFSLPF